MYVHLRPSVMSTKEGVTTLDGWLVRNEGWAKTRVYKARKKINKQTLNKQTNQQSRINRKPSKHKNKNKTKNYQQLNMSGENMDEQDGEAFGDTMRKKSPDTIRVISQNINSIPENPFHFKSRQIVNQVGSHDADAWLFQETGLNWKKIDEASQWTERTRTTGLRLNSNFQFNSTEMDRSEALQAGGVAVITTCSTLTPRCSSSGGDPSGLGRWAWTRIEGSDNRHTHMISVYRPCEPTGPGPGTVYEQHRRFYLKPFTMKFYFFKWKETLSS